MAENCEQKDSAPVKIVDSDVLKYDTIVFCGLILLVQVVFFVYAAATKMNYGHNDLSPLFYTMFIHVSVMIFFGFGFLMTFLRRHGYSAVGLCVATSAIVVELSLVMSGVLKDWAYQDWGGDLNLKSLLIGLFCAGAVMISMGAVLGKVSPSQLLFMGIMETVLFWVNLGIYFTEIEGHDAAGGMVLHTFGAYFGLAVAKVITTPENLTHDDNAPIYSSDMFSLAGTLFLWLLWPSFCGIEAAAGDNMFMAVSNTYVCLVGSVIGFALFSRLLHGGKLNIVEMQNATLAGGVAIGVPADYNLGPVGALALGIAAGAISTIGYAKLDLGKIGLSDTCGVHNLHGMPGILSGLVGIGAFNGGDQLLGMVVTLAIAIGGGLITGAIIKFMPGGLSSKSEFYNDDVFWDVADDYKLKVSTTAGGYKVDEEELS